ncbi:ATP-binding cassette domain-containing protein [Fusibacter sp. JL216-2]|uniref:ABC transporter ATP-binding protein n=1 Tax=Fusibacter sp. JL216-2 TaxID=3071453 RepID=UPI003D344B6B
MILVKNLFHSYTNNEMYAVEDVNFSIQKGEIFGFLGPSGAGKSTTQNILTGLLDIQGGQASIDGEDVRKKSQKLFNIMGVSFEQPNVYRKLTALENLEFYADLFSVPTEDPKKLLKMVGLEDAMHKKAGAFSKGMLQRLVFCRSMLNKPKVWFLDEPTSGLDPTTASRIKDIINEKRRQGATIFLTTHNMYIADELCDRVAFINEGKIAAMDTPRDLKLKHGQKLLRVEYLEGNELIQSSLSMRKEEDKALLKKLIENGQIDTMHSQEASLEQIFIKLTGRGLD